jgi:hypothetical protein
VNDVRIRSSADKRNRTGVGAMLSDIFADWIPVVATGKAVFMIVLDTPIENLALARIGNELNVGLAPPGAEVQRSTPPMPATLHSARSQTRSQS